MAATVSWRAHRALGERVCSFHASEIDRIIDSEGCHDSSRYDVEALERVVAYVGSRYGEQGLCYFVLHHYLDRLVDILTCLVAEYYEGYALGHTDKSLEEIYRRIRSKACSLLVLDPKNILNLTVLNLDTALRALWLLYGGRSRRRRRRELEEALRRAHDKIKTSEELQRLRSIVARVLEKIERDFDCILCTVLTDEGFRSKGTLSKIAAALHAKAAKYVYYAYTRFPAYRDHAEKLLNQDSLAGFIGYLVERSCLACMQ